MVFTTYRRQKAFTLIELLIVLTIIRVLSSCAIPKYIDMSNQAKTAVCKGMLANIRAAILLYNYQYRITGKNIWPTVSQVQGSGDGGSQIMENGIFPNNPFSTGAQRNAVAEASERPNPQGTQGAWAYDTKKGQFWANTASGNDEVNF